VVPRDGSTGEEVVNRPYGSDSKDTGPRGLRKQGPGFRCRPHIIITHDDGWKLGLACMGYAETPRGSDPASTRRKDLDTIPPAHFLPEVPVLREFRPVYHETYLNALREPGRYDPLQIVVSAHSRNVDGHGFRQAFLVQRSTGKPG